MIQQIKKQARVVGTGIYLPKKILTNADLEKMVETSDEWIFTRTGIKERRIAAKDEFTSDMAFAAAQEALAKAKIMPQEIDAILFATLTPDYLFPSTAAILQHRLGATNAAAFDFQAACTGFIYGLSMAKAFIEAGIYRNILLVASEKLSSITNYKDRNTCVLFGDGAAAAVISDQGSGLQIRNVVLGTDGEQVNILLMPAGGCRKPTTHETVENGEHFISINGQEVFKHAVRRMENAAKQCLEQSGLTEQQISWFVPHQANVRIIDAIAKRFNIADEKVFKIVHKYGNTSAPSVAIALHELLHEKPMKKEENILLVALGAGLTWGASLLTQMDE